MIPLPFLKDKNIGVLGMGKTGTATVTALQAAGATIYAWDDSSSFLSSAEATLLRERGRGLTLQPPEEWDWQTLDMLVMSPGLPYTHPAPHIGVMLAQKHGVEIVGDIELLYRACPDARYIAITGTNGKSTTTSLIGHILEQAGRKIQMGGNLGGAVLAMEPLGADGIYVIELSSYQLDLLRSTRFDVAVWMNISPDHLDRHGDLDGYIAAKKHIFDRQSGDDIAVIGVDDAYSEAVAREMIAAGKNVLPIMTTQTSDKGVWVKDGVLHTPLHFPSPRPSPEGEGEEGVMNPLPGERVAQAGEGHRTFDMLHCAALRGVHNHQNAAAAYAACKAVGVAHEQIATAMQSYGGLAHRMQRLAEIDGMVFVNDSKATNADAAAKSLGAYDDIYWIAGGMAKEGGIESLAPFFPRIRHAFLIGAAQAEFAKTLDGQLPYTQSGTLEQAFADAVRAAQKAGGGAILLAPACASFDQFKSFEHRGEMFAELVKSLTETRVSHAV